MDLDDLRYLGPSGCTLTLEERSALEVSMLQRKNDEGFSEMLFWGKIRGTQADYLVAYGLLDSLEFPQKKFFFCTSTNIVLQQLPAIDDVKRQQAAGLTTRFSGDPSAPIEMEGEVDFSDAEGFRELHRLAYAVEAIDHDTAVVPANAYMVQASHRIVKNRAYEGLSQAQAGDLANYYHFRAPETEEAKTAMAKEGLVRSTEFLDQLSPDLPAGAWALQFNGARTMTTLRSLLWPGFSAFHVIGTAKYGSCYIGDGEFNHDVAFML